jgi:hypothetical protein
MNIPMFLTSLIFFLLVTPFAYLCWFKPDEYMLLIKSRRQKISRNIIYRIQLTWIYFLSKHPTIDLFGARMASLFIIIGCLIIMIIALKGPFIG